MLLMHRREGNRERKCRKSSELSSFQIEGSLRQVLPPHTTGDFWTAQSRAVRRRAGETRRERTSLVWDPAACRRKREGKKHSKEFRACGLHLEIHGLHMPMEIF